MTKIWTYISTFMAGIITGLLLFLRLKDPEVVVNDNQRIGKVKQRGDGAVQSTELSERETKRKGDKENGRKGEKEPTERQARRAARRLERRERREKR